MRARNPRTGCGIRGASRRFPYSFVTHGELAAARGGEWLVRELHELGRAAMAGYDGIIDSTAEFRAWTVRRPGQSGRSRLAAVRSSDARGGKDRVTVVSSLLVTVLPLWFGGGFLLSGIVDSVMTHPKHQRRGLSGELMRRAVDFMTAERLDLSLLYTVPDTVPFRFYRPLGYEDYLRVAYLRAESPVPTAGQEYTVCELKADRPEVRALFERPQGECWGHTPLTDELWRWRRLRRPPSFPARLYAASRLGPLAGDAGGRPEGGPPELAFALVSAPVRRGGDQEWITLLSDVTGRLPPGGDPIRALLEPVPPGTGVMGLCAETNREEMRGLLEAGFRKTGEESAMVLPLSDRGARSVQCCPPLWHTITESVVGF